MITEVSRSGLREAARIHSVSWQESHRSFCTPEFIALHTPEHQEEYLRDKMDRGTRIFMLTEGKPVGIVSVTGSLIEDLYILPEYQNRGYGTLLLHYAIRQCEGVPVLWILENNKDAERLYRREGFRETGRRNVITDKLDEIEFCRRKPAMNKTTILFDMYGVILKESKGNFIPYTCQHFGESEYGRLTRQFREEKLFTKAGDGEMTSDEFLSRLGYQDPRFHMADYLENYLTLDEGFVPFAEEFASRYEFVLLSNDVSEWSAYLTKHHGLDRFFTRKIVSGDVKCRKPDRRIYEIALAETGKTPGECLFVDNSVKNLLTAAELGIEPVLFNRDGEEYGGTVVNSFPELAGLLR